MESRGAEVGEEKNKGKGREGKGREDEKNRRFHPRGI